MPRAAQVDISDEPPYEKRGRVTPVVGNNPRTIPRLTTTWKTSQPPTNAARMRP
jgi:hypothetical protein